MKSDQCHLYRSCIAESDLARRFGLALRTIAEWNVAQQSARDIIDVARAALSGIRPGMTWDRALEVMEEGRQVRRAVWRVGASIKLGPGATLESKFLFWGHTEMPFQGSVADFKAFDWEVAA